MNRIRVQTVTMPVLVLAESVKDADGWGTFLNADELWKGGMFVRIATTEDAKKWIRTDFTPKDRALFIGASRLKRAYDCGDEFSLSQAHEMLQPLVKNLASIEDIALGLRTKNGEKMSIKFVRRWNSTLWNYSGLIRDMFEKAKLVTWYSEKDSRFFPALYCPDHTTAAFVVMFMGRIRVCPKCDVPFIPLAGNVDYCCPAHREAHRVARARWRAKQSPEKKRKS